MLAPTTLAPGRRNWQRPVMYGLLLVFWGVAFWNLDQFPPIHFDEATILEPGYQLFYEGVYGSDMYTGFFGQERLYLEVPPVMSLLQGASARLLGVGVWQMRYLPVFFGTLTLALTGALAARVIGSTAAVLAVALLIFWQWTPSRLEFLGSGLPLLDVARIARYDILVPVFGLGAFAAWLRAKVSRNGQASDFAAGVLTGLAGLANVYGAFWMAALGLLTAFEKRGTRLKRLGTLAAGAALPTLAWLAVLAANWNNSLGQFGKHEGRFEVLNPLFYFDNVLNEPHRYFLGVRDPATYLRLGFWLVVIALPAALIWLGWRWRNRGDARARWLLVPALVLPALLAVFDSQKRFYYLMVVVPLFAIILAWATVEAFRSRGRAGRWLLGSLAGLLVVQAVIGVTQQQALAQLEIPPGTVFAALRHAVPAEAGTILGAPQFWLALPDRRYRSMVLPFLLAVTTGITPIPYEMAMERIAPEIVLMDPSFEANLTPNYTAPFWRYMEAHNARVIGEVTGYRGQTVTLYRLDP
jgi:4-amino-4-deoxy-L-arabinose transferase-like glycosyltransferase